MEGDKAAAFINPVPKDIEDACRQAADDCPVTAIFVE